MSDLKVPGDLPPNYEQSATEHGVTKAPRPPAPGLRKIMPLNIPIISYLNSKRVILASASPRRKALLQQVRQSDMASVSQAHNPRWA